MLSRTGLPWLVTLLMLAGYVLGTGAGVSASDQMQYYPYPGYPGACGSSTRLPVPSLPYPPGVTPPPVPSPTATPAPASLPVNGPAVQCFALQSLAYQVPVPLTGQPSTSYPVSSGSVTLAWSARADVTAYVVGRVSAGGTTILPTGGLVIPAGTTYYTDSIPGRDPGYCYVLIALRGSQTAGVSDVLCVLTTAQPASGVSGGAPTNFTIMFDQSRTPSLTWTAPYAGNDGYQLLAFGGPSPRVIPLPGSATRATDAAATGLSCYVLFATSGGLPSGHTEALCSVPAASNLLSSATTQAPGG